MIRNLCSVAALAAAVLLASPASGAEVSVHDPWIREAPPGVPALAGYMSLANEGTKPVALVGVSAEGFAKAMVHETVVQNGVAKMMHRMKVAIAPGATVTFAPGGYHLMLMKPEQPLHAGDRVDITLSFDDGDERRIAFEVRRGR